MSLPKELKDAISNLPSKEKDKLILRLLRKDETLANRLYFELCSAQSVEDKRRDAKKEVKSDVAAATNYYSRYHSVGIFLMYTRHAFGTINKHVSITKDKHGEVLLTLYALTEILEQNKENLAVESARHSHTFSKSIIAKTFKTLLLINKMHEDYRIEYDENLEKLGKLISDIPNLMSYAMHNGLDVNWLITGDIPNDIEKIHKEIRAQGYLK
jgi:hypothetical protein